MAEPFRTTRRVEFRDTDAAGIMHFSTFFLRMEEVEHEMLRSLGLSVIVEDAEGLISWPRVSATCDYRSAVRFEDVLEITAGVVQLGDRSVTYSYQFEHAGRAVAQGRMVAVCCRMIPAHGLKSMPIPAWISEKLAAVQIDDPGPPRQRKPI